MAKTDLEYFKGKASHHFSDGSYGKPQGHRCTMRLSTGGPNADIKKCMGYGYNYPAHSLDCHATHYVFVPDLNYGFSRPRVFTLPANDNFNDEEVGYHGLKASDL